MTIKQSRYITADTTGKKEMAIRTTELDKVKDDPFVRKSEVQQTVNNSTLPVSSRAVNLAIESIEPPSLDGYATEEYVDNKVSSIDLSEYALASDLSSAVESIKGDLDLKADKTELEGLATEDYVNEKVDEKEVGITEPELISKSVGSGKWMREGAYGLGGYAPRGHADNTEVTVSGFFSGHGAAGTEFKYMPYIQVSRSDGRAMQVGMETPSVGMRYRAYNNGSWLPIRELLDDTNTFPDSNGVLHNSRNPIDTLNTSDMADTVVDNDLLTVTSGAVYRALEGKRDLDDNVFNGLISIKSDNDEHGAGILLQESDGTVRGQVVATDQGLQLTQYPKDGGLQTFTFPSEGGGIVVDNMSFTTTSKTVLDFGASSNGATYEDDVVDDMLEEVGYLHIPYGYTLRTSYQYIDAPVYGDGKIILERGVHRPINGRAINPSRTSNNTVLGFGSLVAGSNNLVVGQTCGTNIGEEAKLNVFLGNNIASGDFINPEDNKPVSGVGNVGVGHHALKKIQHGNYNIALGTDALNENKGGSHNIALGMAALQQHVVGFNNIGIGAASGGRLESGTNNTFIGRDSGRELNHSQNTVILGESALRGVTPEQLKFKGDGVQTVFDTGYRGYDSFRVDINGINILPKEYSSNDGYVTLNEPPSSGDDIVITLTKGLGSAEDSVVIGTKSCANANRVYKSTVIGHNTAPDSEALENKIIISNGNKGAMFLNADYYGGDDPRNRAFLNASIYPTVSGLRNLGRSESRFANIFLENAPIVSSDIKFKQDIEDISDKYLRVIGRIDFKQYRLKSKPDKLRFGIIAQDWIKACREEGIDPYGTSILVGNEEVGYSIRYEELLVLHSAYLKWKIDQLGG